MHRERKARTGVVIGTCRSVFSFNEKNDEKHKSQAPIKSPLIFYVIVNLFRMLLDRWCDYQCIIIVIIIIVQLRILPFHPLRPVRISMLVSGKYAIQYSQGKP